MKRLILPLIPIFAVIIAGIIYYVVKDLNQEQKLKTEVNTIMESFNEDSINLDKLTPILDRVETKGDYQIVEKAFKNYVKDYVTDIDFAKLNEVLKESNISSSLTIENFKEDGPEFIKTKKQISDTISYLNSVDNKYNQYMKEEKMLYYLNIEDNYYKDLYNSFLTSFKEESSKKTLSTTINNTVILYSKIENVLNLLKNNKSKWYIEDNQIIFESESLLKSYNLLVNEIK